MSSDASRPNAVDLMVPLTQNESPKLLSDGGGAGGHGRRHLAERWGHLELELPITSLQNLWYIGLR